MRLPSDCACTVRSYIDSAKAGGTTKKNRKREAKDALAALTTGADALDRWHSGGRRGPRPPGRLRPHRAEQLSLFTRAWATPVYRLLDDPDGRPLRLRLKRAF